MSSSGEIPATSPDFKTELVERVAELVPEAVSRGELDFEVLRDLLGADATEQRERFGLFWPGRKAAMRAAQTPTNATLKPRPELSRDWEFSRNVFIEGDNLEVLKILQRHYHRKIKLIYIDPPYNTGKDFVYKDNYTDPLKAYLEFSKQVDEDGKALSSNSESEGRYHSNWLNMMYPRLKLAWNLLSPDGVLCVSIDDHEVAHLKRLLVDIFGENNFQAQLIWDKQHSQQQGMFKRYHEYVLVVTRDSNQRTRIDGGEGEIEAGALKKISKANPASDFTFPPGVRFDAPDGTVFTGTFGGSEKVTVVKGRLIAEGGVTAEEVTLRAGWTQRKRSTNLVSDLKSQAKSGRRSVWKVSRAMTVIAALFLASCAPAVQGDGDQGSLQPPQTQPPHTQPSPNESEDQSGQSLISKDEVDSDHGNLANMLRQSSLEDGLILWGTQTVVAGWEVEQYTDFAEMASRASVVVVARVVGRGPDRHLEGDPGTDDKLTYSSTEIEVVESLAGDASVRAGDRLIVEHFAPSAAAGIDTVGLFFLRYKLHNRMGEEYEQARQEEAGLYRLISHQGVFIDRGDGVPIGPQIEVLRLLDSGLDMPLDEFVFDGPPPDPSEYQLAATARNMSMDELVALVRRAGFK